jgi:hypothetical protein
VLFHESCVQEFFVQPQAGKRFHAERQQRFPNVKPRKFLALEYNDAPPGMSEQRCGSAAGRSSPYDSDIVHCELHRVLMLPNCPDFGREAALSRERPRVATAPCHDTTFRPICANLSGDKMKLIDRFISRELLVNVLFAIAVLSLVLVSGNISVAGKNFPGRALLG